MTQHPSDKSLLFGDSLLADLQTTRARLPNKTLFTLVFGALRVRMMRSTVTMVSIVLAIAFLTYMGLSNQLQRNVAIGVQEVEQRAAQTQDPALRQKAVEDALTIRRLVLRAGINIEEAIAGSTADTWLVIMALLTCTVGIANAMLMSVTERFREIGTMKCLGAQDALVVKLFLLESSMLGVVGAVLGIAAGVAVAVLAAWAQFRGFGLTYFPTTEASLVAMYSILCGIVLPVVGAVYPAYLAARMRPVDALRVDE